MVTKLETIYRVDPLDHLGLSSWIPRIHHLRFDGSWRFCGAIDERRLTEQLQDTKQDISRSR